ncbi:MAG: sulfatase-like hydrolase/transferase [Planctomycetota bacterium JB042]
MSPRLSARIRLTLLFSLLPVPAASSSAAAAGREEAARPARPPNVLLVLADDLGAGDPRASNPASRIETPSIDRIAREGMRFVDAHSSSAVCSPTRYALLTGRYAWRSRMKQGVLWGDDGLLIEPSRPTVADVLRARGYRTACIGKWHLGLGSAEKITEVPEDGFDAGAHTVGFDESLLLPATLDIPPYMYVRDGVPEALPTEWTEGSRRRWDGGGGFWRSGAMAPGFDFVDCQLRFGREAVRFVEGRADAPDEPWFLYFPLTAPHTPWVPAERFVGASEAGWYGDFVAEIDWVVGTLLEALDRTGQADDTLVIFTSDNGSHWRPRDVRRYGHDANLGWRGMKADIHEGGHRVPLYVRWPGRVAAGTKSDALVGLHDLFATLAEIAGASVPDGAAEDSVSFLEALRGGRGARIDLVNHSYDGMFALRSGRWKMIEGLGSGGFTMPARRAAAPGEPEGQLYDLLEDPAEQRNVWEEHERRVAAMRARLAELREG